MELPTVLTIKVYRINPTTGVRRTICEVTLQSEAYKPNPYDLGTFPPCECPIHRTPQDTIRRTHGR